jgi:hypothetical protein
MFANWKGIEMIFGIDERTLELTKQLMDNDPERRHQAADELKKMGPECICGLPALIEHLTNTYGFGKEQAIRGLDLIGPEAIEAIVALVPSALEKEHQVTKESVRQEASEAIKELRQKLEATL